ncbi:hypothetical protein Hamer_G031228 [Homarus americanus]|uniref:Uncharacterized protein n=1 Tax=Homarus americanus TaxID=6706 RepID=A0A8J5T6J6_HOMAM|nr:hypothetical protein Hamer_G031228 [Homarus americanus]
MQICALKRIEACKSGSINVEKRNYPRIVPLGSRRKWMAALENGRYVINWFEEATRSPKMYASHIDDNVGTDIANEEER